MNYTERLSSGNPWRIAQQNRNLRPFSPKSDTEHHNPVEKAKPNFIKTSKTYAICTDNKNHDNKNHNCKVYLTKTMTVKFI